MSLLSHINDQFALANIKSDRFRKIITRLMTYRRMWVKPLWRLLSIALMRQPSLFS